MIIQPELLNKLKDFGLNSYESKIWVALLSRGVSTAGELSDIANVPRSRSYDVLESLEKKGFVILKLGKPIKYLAVAPNEVIERVKKKINQEALSKLKILNEVKSANILDELNLLYKQGIKSVTPFDLSGVIRGRNNLYNHMESMIKKAKKSIYISTTDQGLVRKLNSFKTHLKKAKDNKITIKIAAPITKQNLTIIKKINPSAQIKNINNNTRFCIIDGKEVLIMLSDDKDVHPTYDSGVWINAPNFATHLEEMFNSRFDKAK